MKSPFRASAVAVLVTVVVLMGSAFVRGARGFPYPLESPDQVAKEELRELKAARIGGVVYEPSVDILAACGGSNAGQGYLDLNNDGKIDAVRVVAGAILTKEDWEENGLEVLPDIQDQAYANAKTSAAAVISEMVRREILISRRRSKQGGKASKLSLEQQKQLDLRVEKALRGAMVTGWRYVSTGDDICVLVRVDVPVDINDIYVAGAKVAPPLPGQGEDGGVGGEGSSRERRRHPVPPPGSAGDF